MLQSLGLTGYFLACQSTRLYRKIVITCWRHTMSQCKSGQSAARFTPDELRRYREQFQLFDLNKDGVISVPEMVNVSRKLGYRLSSETIKVRKPVCIKFFAVHGIVNLVTCVYYLVSIVRNIMFYLSLCAFLHWLVRYGSRNIVIIRHTIRIFSSTAFRKSWSHMIWMKMVFCHLMNFSRPCHWTSPTFPRQNTGQYFNIPIESHHGTQVSTLG